MTKEINELFNEWKKFLSWCYENNDKTVEIHRDKIEYVMNYITNLQKENEELQRKYLTINENNQNMQEEMVRTWKKCDDYKQRNEKAVEYIKNDLQISVLPNNQIINGKEVVKRINKIVNILKGGDE